MRRFLNIWILLLISVLAMAQASGLPYACSFEEDDFDASNWVMNYKTPNATDKWIIGSMTHSEGRRSLYISSDGANPSYGNQPNIVASYLLYKFPESSSIQHFDISFDWRGIGDTASSRLYVMICPEFALTANNQNNYYYLANIVNASSGIISTKVVDVCQRLGASGERFVCGSEKWQNVSLTNGLNVSASNSKLPFAIVFIWVNNNIDENVKRSGICIDNLQICSAWAKKPQNVVAESVCEDSTILVSWESASPYFEVQYRQIGTSTWRRADGLTNDVDGFTRNGIECSYRIQRVAEGSYDIRVRGRDRSGTEYTSFVYHNQLLVYCPENHCVNFMDFDSPNVECTYGYRPGSSGHQGETPYSYQGYIDFGPDAKESRHTRHVDPLEVDPRTDSCLHTVPPGAVASVRLGNWNASYEAEAITYSFTVDSAHQGILIVHYAIVLQVPNDNCGDPEFKMEIFDENGNELENLCGVPDFTYSRAAADPTWTRTKAGDVVWKDWTTAGINLQQYSGQDIKVRFTSIDCGAGGHYGYGYFTLDCASAHIETNNCGNDSEISCYAPEGFSYKWFNEAGEVVSVDRELKVDASRQKYTCRVSFIEDPTCYFEVSTISAPRFPVPDYKVEPIYGECLSKLKFTNTSHIMTKYNGEEEHTNEPCEDYHWYFRRLSDGEVTESYTPSPIYLCPSEGDSIEVRQTCYIGVENACDSTRTDTIIVPNILTEPQEFHIETCPEAPVLFDGKWFKSDTVYTTLGENFAGCDSVSILHLKVHPEVPDTYRYDSICSDSSVVINGQSYNQPIEDKLIMLKTIHGCDSAVYLNLSVNPKLQMTMAPYSYSCADDETLYIAFDIAEGHFDSLRIRFDTPQLRDTTIYTDDNIVLIPMPADIEPGSYKATLFFYQFCCGITRQERAIEVRYRSAIIEQKWNDVLTLLSPEYNGGYTFSSIQWYKDGQPLPDETHSYLYQPLDFDAEYTALLTTEDGLAVFTCPVQPVYHEQQTKFPTIVPAGQSMPVYMENQTTIWYFTVSGQLYSTFTLPSGYSTLYVPEQGGVYVLKAINSAGGSQAQVMIVE